MTIGQRIRARREQLGMSQEELAKKMGYKTRNAIYQYEQVENMKLSMISKFAAALECEEYELMGFEDEEQQSKKEENPETLRKAVEIAAFLNQLNDEGFAEAMKRIEELTQLEKYRKN